jgi:hypothetical protein
MTYIHMNRICANVNYLAGSSVVKDDWVHNDYMLRSEWDKILEALNELAEWCNLGGDPLTSGCLTSVGVNEVEDLAYQLKDLVDLRRAQAAANFYSGDGSIAGEYIYAGGYE